MIDKLFGTETAGFILLYIFHYGDGHIRGIANDLGISRSSVQNQLHKFEEAGVIVCKEYGRTRSYFFNKKNPVTKPLMEILNIVHSSMSLSEKEKFFSKRRRPRSPGKPVIGRGNEN